MLNQLDLDRHLQNLLRRFILHSWSPLRIIRDNTNSAMDNFRALALNLSCSEAEVDDRVLLACLKNKSSSEITLAVTAMKEVLGPQFGPSFNAYPLQGKQPSKLYRNQVSLDGFLVYVRALLDLKTRPNVS